MSREFIDELDDIFAELREKIKILETRVIVEKELADYWYNRCMLERMGK